MPSTATITAFYSFSANTKARAALVNTNFSNFRGHIVAIDPNTQTASNETYDLGSSEYRWRTGYFREIDFKSNTTTAGRTKFVGDTTGVLDVFISGSTLGSFKSDGFTRGGIKASSLIQVSPNTSGNFSISTTATWLWTMSFTSNGHIGMYGLNFVATASSSALTTQNTTVSPLTVSLVVYRDGTGASNIIFDNTINITAGKTTTTANDVSGFVSLRNFDFSLTPGGHTYYFYLRSSARMCNGGSTTRMCFAELI